MSYAREDADAARRIADALRTAGVEVWFDREELRGGDAWDQKIRKQIKACALFLPVISGSTQARREGYFRLEWKLAVQRTYLIADGSPFLLPVVIDNTGEAGALVPEEFRQVQWISLAAGQPTHAVVDRVNALLASESQASSLSTAGTSQPGRAIRRRKPRASWRWFGTVGAAVTAFAILAWQNWRAREATRSPTENRTEAAKPDETSRLIAQARELIYDVEAARNEFALAESLLKRAGDLAPDSPQVWGLSALVNIEFVARDFDPREERSARARADAEKALRLDAGNVDALIALAKYQSARGDRDLAKQLLERARAAHPQEAKVYVELATHVPSRRERLRFQKEAARVVTDNRELLYHASNNARGQRLWSEAVELSNELLNRSPFWRAYVARAITEYQLTADPDKVTQWLDKMPPLKRDEPRAAILRFKVAMLRRDGNAAELALRVLPDQIHDRTYIGSRAFLIAQARELAGRHDSAMGQWRLAEEALRESLKRSPDAFGVRAQLAVALAAQKRTNEAKEIVDLFISRGSSSVDIAHACVLLGEHSSAIAVLRKGVPNGPLSTATLRAEPRWEPLGKHPDFAALVRAFAQADGLSVPGERIEVSQQKQ